MDTDDWMLVVIVNIIYLTDKFLDQITKLQQYGQNMANQTG